MFDDEFDDELQEEEETATREAEEDEWEDLLKSLTECDAVHDSDTDQLLSDSGELATDWDSWSGRNTERQRGDNAREDPLPQYRSEPTPSTNPLAANENIAAPQTHLEYEIYSHLTDQLRDIRISNCNPSTRCCIDEEGATLRVGSADARPLGYAEMAKEQRTDDAQKELVKWGAEKLLDHLAESLLTLPFAILKTEVPFPIDVGIKVFIDLLHSENGPGTYDQTCGPAPTPSPSNFQAPGQILMNRP
jgi:hypothetical protein